MSDLIDFESPNTKNIALLLPSPLIPAPENLKNDGFNSNEAGSHNGESEKCRSTENNPFDIVMKKIIDYERNKEDPFETVIEKANECTIKIPESRDNYSTQNTKYLDIVKTNNALKETEINIDIPLLKGENDMSIITDLNNTNLISDSINENEIISTLSCDNNIPNIYISPTSYNKDLSLLNNSSMNDSLMDHDGDLTKEIKNIPTDFSTCFKSMSQNCCKQNFLGIQNKRSMSMSDTLKSNMFGEDYLLNSAHSSIFEDPFNKAFRKNSLRSTVSYNSSYLSNQFDLSLSKQNLDRRISNSSVFSGLSNISVIPTDPVLKIRHNRFCSESSLFSGISNVSTISTNNFISSSDSSVFSNDTLNKGFINSQTQPTDSTNSTTDPNPVNACEKSDLIKKFFEIKRRMSTAEIEKPKIEDNEQIQINHSCTKYDSQIEKKENYDEKLIDIDSSFNSVFNDETEVNEIILNEARLLAETFEKMASSKESTSITEDDLLSKIKLNFDYLPKSDDETVDNLIDLPTSPLKNTLLSKVDTSTEKHVESNVILLQDNIKALENEFIEKKSYNKKATTATLLLDLEKLIKEENNPDAYKVLNDLQKLLGIEYDNNAEILQLYLQNTDNLQNKNSEELHFSRNIDNSNYESNTSKQNIISDRDSATTNKQLKTKFKKKFNSDIVTKKGPLKAIIPLDNMEKRVISTGSINKKMSLNNVTPPKPIDVVPTLNIVSSTPNTNEINKNCKSEPTASSTPNIEGLRMQRTIVQKSLTLNSKSTLISNVSSALLSSNTKEPVGLSVNCNKRMQRTLSPQKRSFTPKKTFESSLESRLPRYSPRPIRVRNYSFDDLKTAKSLQTMSNVPKFSSEKKLNRPIILSPLKNCNKVKHKEKFVSRLGKSSNMQSDSEKENYA
ncbi:PREDICTED: kinesin-related protein 4-like [Ceratosolen solmsi marchali]|uniref:Kinesin-related protein 4-like n=1 Tax=Ceratosolen solmsi marchali TaxID=326594 RepID=A0AAJ6YNW5_9HYME|nr:PREDICTED: kinesin-related protein 4-like [Ceratosolen solmsi marchali]